VDAHRPRVEQLAGGDGGAAPRGRVGDAPAEYVDRILRDTVGVELPIARLDGKWKMSRNRPAADVAGVIAGLAASDDAGARAAAASVAERRPPSTR
jgi:transcriptional regulator